MGKWRRNKSLRRRWEKNHLIAKYGAICALCGKPFKSKKDITIDHHVPISRGGFDLLENYRLAHDGCNKMKGSMTPEEFELFQSGVE